MLWAGVVSSKMACHVVFIAALLFVPLVTRGDDSTSGGADASEAPAAPASAVANATSTGATSSNATSSNATSTASVTNSTDADGPDAGFMRVSAGPRGAPASRPRITCRPRYLYHPERADWESARVMCEMSGGQLAVLSSPTIQRRISSRFGEFEEFWIGASDIEREGQFRWVNGRSWGFQNWYKSQPNPGKGEHCVTFNYWGKKNSQWGDRKCLLSKPFLCETMVCAPVRPRFPNRYPGSFKGPIVDWRRFPQNRNFPGPRGRSGIATKYVAGGRGFPYNSQEDVRSTIHL